MKIQFLNFIANIFEVPAETISLETKIGSIPEWDSLMQLRLVVEIEEKYNVEIPLDEVSKIKTLADFYQYILNIDN